MKIVTCCKIVPNEEEIKVLPSRALSMDGTPWKISQYDLNALESGKQLAAETSGTVTALSVGCSAALDSSKIRKDVLSRGADELNLVIDDGRKFSDSLETAKALTEALKGMEYDVVLCGMGSSDLYLQEVGIQTGTLLGVPTVNNVTDIKPAGDGVLHVERTLEDEVEVLEVTLPAVICVSSEINVPSVPAMREIMRAGKKPVNVLDAAAAEDATCLAMLEELAPEQQERRQEVIEGDGEDAVDALVQFLKKECL